MGALAVMLLGVLWVSVIVGVNLLFSARRTAVLMNAVQSVAQTAGLSDVRSRSFDRVLGSWRGYSVTWWIRGGGRDGPERVVVEIAAATPTRMTIHRRRRFDFGLRLLGPPAVQTALDGEYAVRSDDILLAEHLLGDEKIAAEMSVTIQDRRDELELNASRVRATRVTRSATSRAEPAHAAWQLAAAVVEQLGFPPAESGG